MDKNAYLNRIDYRGPISPTLEILRSLHLAHLLAVPFENLDIHLGRPIILDEERFFEKIVSHRRGGFCYELNGLFALLLEDLGFDVTRHSARVYRGSGFGPEFDHLVLVARLEEQWLVDVGFGSCFRFPLRLHESEDQTQLGHTYRIACDGESWTMLERNAAGENVDGYAFTLKPRRLSEFAGRCHYHQTSALSHFTQKRICSRATPDGRITLSDLKLIITERGERREWLLNEGNEYSAALREHFGINLVNVEYRDPTH